MLLSIIIVNFKSTSLIRDCLRSVYLKNPTFPIEVIIVSNSKLENERAIVLDSYPAVKWIQMDYNSGFARANNAGMKGSQGDHLLLLNPDTVSIDDSITKCCIKLRDSDLVAAGVQLIDIDHKPQISGNFFVKGGLNHLLPIPYWGDFIRWVGYRLNAKLPSVEQAKDIEEVDWISGAFLMVKKSVTDKVGLMDEDFFLYAEEVEWCSRLRKQGKLCIYGDLKIIHLEGGTIDAVSKPEVKGYANLYDKKGLQLMVSNNLRVRKQYGVFWFLVLIINYT